MHEKSKNYACKKLMYGFQKIFIQIAFLKRLFYLKVRDTSTGSMPPTAGSRPSENQEFETQPGCATWVAWNLVLFHLMIHSPQMDRMAGAGPGGSQELATLSRHATCMAETQTLRPSCISFPGILAGSWIRSRVAGTQHCTHKGCW